MSSVLVEVMLPIDTPQACVVSSYLFETTYKYENGKFNTTKNVLSLSIRSDN